MPRIWQVVNNNGQSAKLICNGEVKIVKRQEAATVEDFVQGLRAVSRFTTPPLGHSL
jgi:hypothetical protein